MDCKRVTVDVASLGDISTHLATINGAPPVDLSFVAKSSESTPLHIHRNKDSVRIYGAIKSLPLKTHWVTRTCDTGSFFVPVFDPTVPGSIYLTHHWEVPDGMTISLVVCGGGDPQYINRWKVGTAYLVTRVAGVAGSWLLPLPNLYSDARMCLAKAGMPAQDLPRGALVTLWEGVWDIVKESNWNTDLMPANQDASQKLFRFTPAGMPSPDATTWQECMTRISSTVYDSLPYL